MNGAALAPTLTVTYGDAAQCRVEFCLDPVSGQLLGRYLPGADGVGRLTDWDVYEPDDSSDAAHVAILAALREVLTQYAAGSDSDRREPRAGGIPGDGWSPGRVPSISD